MESHKNLKLNLKSRYTKYMDIPKDIAIIELKETDELYNDILFLNYDLNYIKQGYEIYKDADIFSIEHPLGDDASCASGRIININDYEFEHDISTDNGSSGCPILLLHYNINFIHVIGIHKDADYSRKLNGGTFIGEIFEEDFDQKNIKIENNHIIAEIYIKDDDVDKEIRIINSYEEYLRKGKDSNEIQNNRDFNNEEEIKKCKIIIDDETVPFNYYHKFLFQGKYIIKYDFKDKIEKTVLMFGDCDLLTKINLSNFNTDNVTKMNNMFDGCSSLTKINLSNLNTKNVTDMSYMFNGCSSLTNIELSNFDTRNVTDMENMFYGCSSLINIDLPNFNTKNVTDMNRMFFECSSLENINLSGFNTQKVTDMSSMFGGCSSLTYIYLSNFNTQNVTNMSYMFGDCISLTNLNISNFTIKNVINMNHMFYGCSYLKKQNIIIKDEKIFDHIYFLNN